MNGKGSKRRPQLVSDTTFGDNWEKIFKQSRHVEKEKKLENSDVIDAKKLVTQKEGMLLKTLITITK